MRIAILALLLLAVPAFGQRRGPRLPECLRFATPPPQCKRHSPPAPKRPRRMKDAEKGRQAE